MKRAVVNVVAGKDALAMHRITRQNHSDYAERLEAEYVVIQRDAAPEYALSIKYLVSNVAEQFDQVLYLDLDTVISLKAPNIFDEVPVGYWGVIDESGRMDGWNERIQREADEIADALMIPRVPLMRMVNAGVMVLPTNAKRWYWPPANKKVPKQHLFEQTYLSMCLQSDNAPIVELDWRWNWCYLHQYFEVRKHQAFIVHLAGAPDRREHLKKLVSSHAATT